jgi:hypothetical protein
MQAGWLGACALMAVLGAGCAKPSDSKFMDPIPSNNQLRQDVSEARRSLEQAIARRDGVSLERLLAADFVQIGPAGELKDKAGFIQQTLAKPAAPDAQAATDEVLTRVYGNTAVVIGRQVTREKPGAAGASARFSATFVRESGMWRAVALQWTRLPA